MKDGDDRRRQGVRAPAPLPASSVAVAAGTVAERGRDHSHERGAASSVARGLAHDVSNLLAAILGFAQLAKLALDSPRELESHLDMVESATRRAADLAHELMDPTDQRLAPSRTISLAAAVHEALRILRLDIDARRVQVKCLPDRKLHTVRGQATQLQRVVVNLMLNALEASDGEGSTIQVLIRSRTRTREDLETYRGGTRLEAGMYVELSVKDTGCGMTSQVLAGAFRPRFTTKQHGHGLGLAAALSVAEAHGGAMRIASRAGLGTTVALLLPPAPAPTS